MKICHIYITESHPALNNKVVKFTSKRTELKTTILSEVTQPQKRKVTCFLLFADFSCDYSGMCASFGMHTEARRLWRDSRGRLSIGRGRNHYNENNGTGRFMLQRRRMHGRGGNMATVKAVERSGPFTVSFLFLKWHLLILSMYTYMHVQHNTRVGVTGPHRNCSRMCSHNVGTGGRSNSGLPAWSQGSAHTEPPQSPDSSFLG